ncbi:MAG TPA: hypothetical protein VFB66_27660 [Tepidisphaeraceae bacterium]|nr:hypothetical protein [Tepidisphaeraceae bacterium]
MIQRLVQAASLLSLLLSVASAGLLVYGIFSNRVWFRMVVAPDGSGHGPESVGLCTGRAQYEWVRTRTSDPRRVPRIPPHMLSWSSRRNRPDFSGGLRPWVLPVYHRASPTPDTSTRSVWVPYLPVMLVAAVPPSISLRRTLRRRRRKRLGLCMKCGYDLRGVPGKCPECGTPVPRSRRIPEVAA